MKIKFRNLILVSSAFIYIVVILIFLKEYLYFSDAQSIFKYVANRPSVPNNNLLFFISPYVFENFLLSILALFTKTFLTEYSFTVICTLLTFIITLNTSKKIALYNGLSENSASVISVFTIFLFLLIPIGKLGLINTQSSFLALQIAFGTNTLFKPRFKYLLFHWVYIPASGVIIYFEKVMNFIKKLKLKFNQLFLNTFFLFLGIVSLSYIGKLKNIFIKVETSVPLVFTFIISLTLIFLNYSFFYLVKKKLYLNLTLISFISLIVTFFSAKTSNRLCITLIFYDLVAFTTLIFINSKIKKEYPMVLNK